MLKFGIAGFGPWGRNYFKAVHDTGIAELTHVWLRKESRARPFAQQSGLEIVDSVDGLVGLDAVIVALHPRASPKACNHLLSNGIPVMVEKPVALNFAEATALAHAAEASGLPFLVNHQHLFSTAFETMRDRLAGECEYSINSHAGNVGPFRDYSPWWDYGPHDIAMCLALAGTLPIEVTVQNVLEGEGTEFNATLDFGRNPVSKSTIRVSNGHSPKVRIFQAGEYIYNDLDPSGYRLRYKSMPIELKCDVPPLTRAVKAFAESIQTQDISDYRFGGTWAMNVVDVLRRIDSQSTIFLPEY